jgi:hypothetical protein
VVRVQATLIQADLMDRWVTDGRRGFFAGSPRQPLQASFSLYETMWRLSLRRLRGDGAGWLDPSRMAAWIDDALDGSMTGSGLPVIGQLWYGVRVLRQAGAPVSAGRVSRVLGMLRAGGRYRGTVSSGPDWGSTALAVRLLTTLCLPVPQPVVTDAGAALTVWDTEAVPTARLPWLVCLLQIAADLGGRLRGRVDPAVTGRLAVSAERILAATPPGPVWLSQLAALRDAERGLGIGGIRPPDPVALERALAAGDQARSQLSDPQALYYAIELGWQAGPVEIAHSRVGWPKRGAVAQGLASSVAALRTAAEFGVHATFAPQLRRQLAEVWQPEVAGVTAGGADQAAVRLLDGLLTALDGG